MLTEFKALARIPPGLRKDLPKGGVVLSFPRSSLRCFVVSSFRRSCCRGVVVSPMGCTTSRPEIFENPSKIDSQIISGRFRDQKS